ncbi:MAG: C39 family peptidase [Myxococcales bacterium]|nr:C39 family peptidase [Myxococcales bacterium]
MADRRARRASHKSLILLTPSLLLITASACGADGELPVQSAQAARPAFSSVLLRNVPHVRQKPDFCGEACVEMATSRLGKRVSQDQVFALTGLSPALGRGAYTRELVLALRRLGFDPGTVWYAARPRHAAADLGKQFAALHHDLRRGVPSIVCTHFDTSPNTTEHFRLVIGYDAKRDEIIYHDPALQRGAYKRMSRRMLYRLWPLKYKRDQWTVIRLPLRVRKLAAPRRDAAMGGRFSAADYAQHVMKLKQRLPRGFHVVIERPFVVVGNESRARVAARARSTVRWATQRLKREYFSRDPQHILTVWLFKDRATYRYYNKKLFGELPGTPYGFYSSTHRALVMNIATGGGTLVHEIVHPFIEANFPNAPPWLNEGLGSLYEQSASRNGRIVGLTNWRLAGLQSAIRKGSVPSFRYLTSRSTNQFYNQDPGTNYSQSRYLMYYLQQSGKLRTFYHAFHKAQRSDPSGYKTLQRVLGGGNMVKFKKAWERWVLTLRYP